MLQSHSEISAKSVSDSRLTAAIDQQRSASAGSGSTDSLRPDTPEQRDGTRGKALGDSG